MVVSARPTPSLVAREHMDSFRSYYSQHASTLWLLVALAVVALFIWLVVTTIQHRRLVRRFESLFAAAETGNVPAMLADYLATVRRVAGQTGEMQERFDRLMGVFPTVVRHVGLVRFSPFHDTGGDQSFSLAILDGHRDGVVISALHSRQESRLFAKPIASGSSQYHLTDEERRAIDQALGVAPPEPSVRP
jgi:heme exporter protein D